MPCVQCFLHEVYAELMSAHSALIMQLSVPSIRTADLFRIIIKVECLVEVLSNEDPLG